MLRRGLLRAALLALGALALAGPSTAFAAPADDAWEVFQDWRPDGKVTECRFTRAQLVNARDVAGAVADFDSYAPGFRDEVNQEIARHDSGGCSGVTPDPPPSTRTADAQAVFADWRPDGRITACRFTRAQLVNARDVTGMLPNFDTAAPGFRNAVNGEIARHDSGGCRGVTPGPSAGARARSAVRTLGIRRIRPRGDLTESVTIRNSGSSALGLRGVTLRDRSGRRVKLGSKRLGARRSLRVYTGCAKGRTKAYRRGSRLYACLKRGVWDDRGDVVKIVDRRRVVVAQRGFGRFRRVVRF